MKKVLFICSKNRLRSPTAEHVFANLPGLDTASAGLAHDADNPVTAELIAWSELIFVMEKAHRRKLSEKFRKYLGGKRIVCLDIPDDYGFMAPELIAILQTKVPRYLRS